MCVFKKTTTKKPLSSDLSAPLQSRYPHPPHHFSRKEVQETFWAMVPLWGWDSVPPGPPDVHSYINEFSDCVLHTKTAAFHSIFNHSRCVITSWLIWSVFVTMQHDLYLKTDLCYIKNSILNQPCHCIVKNLVKCLAGLWDRERTHCDIWNI